MKSGIRKTSFIVYLQFEWTLWYRTIKNIHKHYQHQHHTQEIWNSEEVRNTLIITWLITNYETSTISTISYLVIYRQQKFYQYFCQLYFSLILHLPILNDSHSTARGCYFASHVGWICRPRLSCLALFWASSQLRKKMTVVCRAGTHSGLVPRQVHWLSQKALTANSANFTTA